jgi:hypothetical protein
MLRGFLREDTVTGKAWYYSLSNSTERLIMDLSLTVGDSVNLLLWPDNGWVFVDSVYFSSGRKFIRLNTTTLGEVGWGEKLLYIEGVGTNRGIQYLVSPSLNTSPYLLCSYNNSQLEYTNNNSNFNGCKLLYTSIHDIQNDENSRIIFPNPISEQAILKFNNPNNTQFVFTIFDLSGMKINEFETNSASILIKKDAIRSGIYFYKLYNKSTTDFYVGKIIFINQ